MVAPTQQKFVTCVSKVDCRALKKHTYSSRVVHGREQHEGRIGNRFKCATDHPQCSQGGKVLGDGLEPMTRRKCMSVLSGIGGLGSKVRT